MRRRLNIVLGVLVLAWAIPAGAQRGPRGIAGPSDPSSGSPYVPFSSPAQVYSGISGAGRPVTGDGTGGYRTGREGVYYSGPNPKQGWNLNWGSRANGAAVRFGIIPPLRPIWDIHLRDTQICLAGDGNYYMTGSSGDNIWDTNDGVELWRSQDLTSWQYLGLVWDLHTDATWAKPSRYVWAPEIHFIKGNFYIVYSSGGGPGGAGSGSGILISVTGKPTGPYRNTVPADTRLAPGIDPTLFVDDDGKVYFTNRGGGIIWQMKDDLSGFVDQGRVIQFDPPPDGSYNRATIAQEGATIFKANGKYYLSGAAFYHGRYSSVCGIADSIYGPYHDWHEAVPCGGGGGYFQDKAGNWWCSLFGNDDESPWREKPGLVRIEFSPDLRIHIAPIQPDFVLVESARRHLP